MDTDSRPLRLADSHAHLNNPDFANDLEEVAARLSGFLVLNASYNLESSEKAIAMAGQYPGMYASAGIHPHDADGIAEADWAKLEKLARHPKVVAIGETGLDYFRHRSTEKAQKAALVRHLAIARAVKKPVIIHCRDAFGDILPFLKEGVDPSEGGVLHCFSEGPAEARAGVALGLHVSFAGNITYPKAQNLRDAARVVPSERLLIETDCPYLAPQAHRGKRNEPAYLPEVVKTVAAERGVTVEDVARVTYANFERLFLGKKPKKAEIVYKIRDSLYVNVTRECGNVCVFCPRLEDPTVQGYYLGVDKEPSSAEIVAAIGDLRPSEVVLCGFGEPTMRLDVVKEVSAEMKKRGLKVRLNTNGQGSLVNRRDIVPELKGLVDVVSVSLNAADAETYNRLCNPSDPEHAWEAVLDFIRHSRETLPETVATAVAVPHGVDLVAVKRLAEDGLKVKFRLRDFNMVG